MNEYGTLAAWADSSLDMYKVRDCLSDRADFYSDSCRDQQYDVRIVWASSPAEKGIALEDERKLPHCMPHSSIYALPKITTHAQPELARVLWPVFMHVYLELVRRSATGPAHTLLARHRPRFAGTAADAAPLPHAQVRHPQCLCTAAIPGTEPWWHPCQPVM